METKSAEGDDMATCGETGNRWLRDKTRKKYDVHVLSQDSNALSRRQDEGRLEGGGAEDEN